MKSPTEVEPESIEFVAFLERSKASLAKVQVVPQYPQLRLRSRHPVRGYVTLLGALKYRTPEQIIDDLGLLTVAERLSFGCFTAEELLRSRLPFGGNLHDGNIEGVNILRVLHPPLPKHLSCRADTRLPDGKRFRPGDG